MVYLSSDNKDMCQKPRLDILTSDTFENRGY